MFGSAAGSHQDDDEDREPDETEDGALIGVGPAASSSSCRAGSVTWLPSPSASSRRCASCIPARMPPTMPLSRKPTPSSARMVPKTSTFSRPFQAVPGLTVNTRPLGAGKLSPGRRPHSRRGAPQASPPSVQGSSGQGSRIRRS